MSMALAILRTYVVADSVCYIARVEICRDRLDRRSCKICANYVNFTKNNAISRIICQELKDLHTSSVILHDNC